MDSVASMELIAILKIGHESSMRGAGRSLRDLLQATRYRELRPGLNEEILLRAIQRDPNLVEEWIAYSEDKRTTGGWALSRWGEEPGVTGMGSTGAV